MADELHVITHIDLIPKRAPDGTPQLDESVVVLDDYGPRVVTDPGVLHFELLQQVYRKNHFEMLTVFSSLEAYEAHRESAICREFRERLHPLLGAPFDDRLHYLYTGE